MKILIRLTLATLLLGGACAGATPKHSAEDSDVEKGPSLNPGDRFSVRGYDVRTNTYALQLKNDPSAGPLVASPEDLARAVRAVDPAALRKNPLVIVHFPYSVDDDHELKLLTAEEITSRAAKIKKSAAKSPN